jgi:hypothetical protein
VAEEAEVVWVFSSESKSRKSVEPIVGKQTRFMRFMDEEGPSQRKAGNAELDMLDRYIN